MPFVDADHSPRPRASRAVIGWLVGVMVMIFAMVLVGGITRLTGSGLSMVDWHPLMGAIPPLSDEAWQATFAQYQTSPQYQQVNHWMTLADFQRIFFWEYLHRLFGRLIGVVFFVPWLWFTMRGQLVGALRWKALVAFVLGGAQGLLGWFMVKSGLVDVPEVSHLRLAAHLSLAFIVQMWILWIVLDEVAPRGATGPRWALRASVGAVALVALQIVYGAFMAGKKAGLLFATWPLMNGTVWPPHSLDGGGAAIVESPLFIHAFHRWFAWAVAAAVVALAVGAYRTSDRLTQRVLAGCVAVVVVQVALGALTVMLAVPTAVAVAHQGVALVLLGQCVALVHRYRTR